MTLVGQKDPRTTADLLFGGEFFRPEWQICRRERPIGTERAQAAGQTLQDRFGRFAGQFLFASVHEFSQHLASAARPFPAATPDLKLAPREWRNRERGLLEGERVRRAQPGKL